MIKILLCLLLLTGCTLNLNQSSYPTEFNWDEISFDWVKEERIHDEIGHVLSGGPGSFPFQFSSKDGNYSFYYKDFKMRNYNIYGRWDENIIYIDYPIVNFDYQENGAEKEAILSLDATIENGNIISDSILKADGQYYYVSIDCITGKYLIQDAETNKTAYLENDELWMNSYAYLYHFYEEVYNMEKIISSTKTKFWEGIGWTIKKENQVERKIPADNEYWQRNPLLWYSGVTIEYENEVGTQRRPGDSERHFPQLKEIFKKLDIKPVSTIPNADSSELIFKLYETDFDNLVDNLPTLEVFYFENQFYINCDFGFATFESEELKTYLLGLFDDEKATREYLQKIQEEEIIEAYLSYGLYEIKTIYITEKDWIYSIVEQLSTCEYADEVIYELQPSENFALFIIYEQDNELKSLLIQKITDSMAWVYYEGKIIQYRCPNVIHCVDERIQSITK